MAIYTLGEYNSNEFAFKIKVQRKSVILAIKNHYEIAPIDNYKKHGMLFGGKSKSVGSWSLVWENKCTP